MKYFIDTEFIEGFNKPLFGKRRHFIDLISIGIVDESGREYYSVSKDFDLKEVWNKHDLKRVNVGGDVRNIYPEGFYMKKEYWLRDNVLKPIYSELLEKEVNIIYKAIQCRTTYGTNYKSEFCYSTLKELIKRHGKSNNQIAQEIRNFIYSENINDGGQLVLGKFFLNKLPEPEFYGYFAGYDWVLFCSLFGRMIDLPKGFPMYCNDLKQSFDNYISANIYKWREVDKNLDWVKYIKELPNYPKQTNEHNALSDAKFNLNLYNFLNSL